MWETLPLNRTLVRLPLVLCLMALVLPVAKSGPEPCMVQLLEEPGEIGIAYDPFSPSPVMETVPLRLMNLSSGHCDLLLETVIPGVGTRQMELAGSGVLAEFVLGSSEAESRGLSGSRLRLSIAPEDARSAELGIRLEPGAFPSPGVYPEEVRFRVRDAATERPLLDDILVRFDVEVLSRARINIAGSHGSRARRPGTTLVDLGELQTGMERDVPVHIHANEAYSLTIESENRGELRHVQRPELPAVSYSVGLHGQWSDLGTPMMLRMHRPPTIRGEFLPLRIRIGETQGLMAGTYRDRVHVTVDALH